MKMILSKRSHLQQVGVSIPSIINRYNCYSPPNCPMDMNTQTNTKMTEYLFSLLYDFVEDMNPDLEMCLDFCESQGIYISDSVYDVITDLLWNKENN